MFLFWTWLLHLKPCKFYSSGMLHNISYKIVYYLEKNKNQGTARAEKNTKRISGFNVKPLTVMKI